MPINKQPNVGLLIPSEDMVFGLDLRKRSSKHSGSKTAKESSVFPQSNRSPKDADKLKSKSGVSPRGSDLKQKAKQNAEGNVQSRENSKRSANESDELVKHMSNLPGYLLHTDRVENSREKAFNVGVLDWSRLEKWKDKHIPDIASHFTPCHLTPFNKSKSPSRTATKSSTSFGGRGKLDDKRGVHSPGSRPTNRDVSWSESTKLPFQNVTQSESSKSRRKSVGDVQKMAPYPFESFRKTSTDVCLEIERKSDYSKRTSPVGNVASNSRNRRVSFASTENGNGRDDGVKQKMEGPQEYNSKKKERNDKFSSDMLHPPPISKIKGSSLSSKKTSSSESETKKKLDQLQESDFDSSRKHDCGKPSNIVLLYPHEIPHSSSSDDCRFSEFISSDENFPESSRSSLSCVSIPDDVYPEDGGSEIPLPSALRSVVGNTSRSESMRHSINSDQVKDRSSIINKMPDLQSGAAFFENNMFDTSLGDQCAFRDLREPLDQETAELTSQKGMNLSHNRRFSFNLGRISRSFSFKEGPTVPQCSSRYVSARSGPVTPETSVRWNNPGKEKANSQNKRSSPLRRLLDPLLKHKTSSDTRHSAESNQTQKGSTSSVSFKNIGVNESLLQHQKSKGSSTQGLLQLTIKNGVPMFKFVLNNERKIYAATRNSLASQENCCLTFYLVNEIKKKSGGWMSHGNKGKSCGYAYNTVAQMKLSGSKITEPINQNSKYMVKEYVLLDVEIGQTDQGPPTFIQSRELAAVVIETPCENLSREGLPKKGCIKCLTEEKCLCSSAENNISSTTTVILPGGVHGSPNKGEPSPLIHRWKTGGLCDCGGWDIGCKLLVLCEQKRSLSIPRIYIPSHDRFELFVQEGDEQDKPLFSLLPLKNGFYSVEFSSAITHLQALFIAVTILSRQKAPGSLETGCMHQHEEFPKEPSSKDNGRLRGKAPVKYTPTPPHSPAGRV